MIELTNQERELLVALLMQTNAPLKEHGLWMALVSKLQVVPAEPTTDVTESTLSSTIEAITPEEQAATDALQN